MMMPLVQYLERYAEPEAAEIHSLSIPSGHYQAAVAVPLCGEKASALTLLESLSQSALHCRKRAIVAVVINAREDSEPQHHEANRWLLDELRQLELAAGTSHELISWRRFSDSLDIILVDRATEGRYFPEKQGVGLARKIGCDVLCVLNYQRRLLSQWIHTTDGDATVSETYLSDRASLPRWPQGMGPLPSSARLHRYRHLPSGENDEAHILYEASLRYYVLGLAHAGSAYAFETVGSTIALDIGSYSIVRGFPKREAAEDFYILNKLAKVGKFQIGEGTVSLHNRVSNRVPFGTGAATAKISDSLDSYTLYHPDSFLWLKAWEDAFKTFGFHRDVNRLETDTLHNLERMRGREAGLELVECLKGMEAFTAAKIAARTRTNPEGIHAHLQTWFDGFRTLKLIHLIRDRALPVMRFQSALDSAEFLAKIQSDTPKSRLERLREEEESR